MCGGTEQPLAQYRLVDQDTEESEPKEKKDCGPDCYKHAEKKEPGSSAGSVGKKRDSSTRPWSDDEKAIFRRARETFQGDWCRVAALMGTRS